MNKTKGSERVPDMIIQIDTHEKVAAVKRIKGQFDALGIEWIPSKMHVGDYQDFFNPRVVIERKKDLLELAGNVGQDHRRFSAELKEAQRLGIKLIILCEHGGQIQALEDVPKWVNPRLKDSPLAISGERLYKILLTMSLNYNVEIHFCDKRKTGAEIVRLLKEGADD